jgi:nucleoside-diphosphate-sugar epimerase
MIFVTGGTGLLGSHLLLELTRNNNKPITAIYRNKDKIAFVKSLFDHYLSGDTKEYFDRITWEKCDLLDLPRLEMLIEGHSEVYHCAALVSFKRRDFNKLMEINREGTTGILNISLAKKVEKFCFVSSTAAVGNKGINEDELVNEEGKWITSNDTSGYSISKYSAEKEVWRAAEEGLNVVIVNPSILFGAGNWRESSLVIFNTIKKGLKFYSPGANAFVDARDVASIMVQLMDKNIFGERFLCIGENAKFKTVFNLIAQHLNAKPPKYKVNKYLMGVAWRVSIFWGAITFSAPAITKSSARSAFTKIKFDNSKIRKTLNFNFMTLEEMIQNTIEGNLTP